jgi:lysophospholipase L1-like esterase
MMREQGARAPACLIAMALAAAGVEPIVGCGSSSPPDRPTLGPGDDASGTGSGGTYDDSGTPSPGTVGSEVGSTDDGSPDAAPYDTDGNSPTGSGNGPGDGGGCTKGSVTPNEVVMIGDSYFDPFYSQAAVDLFANVQDAGSLPANTTYRHYYQGGASMNSGDLQFNIPYQYETEAMTDTSVSMPTDIKVIIMDGGGNDVLINDRSCLTSPPPGNTECASTIQGVVTRATSLLDEMSTNGVQTIVYLFYPHLDPDGGGLLPMPNTADPTLDYAYPLAEQLCCGASFTSTVTNYTCTGNIGSAKCLFVDARPAFGDNWATLINQTDYVHPTPAGAQIIANLIWKAMQDNCIAQ